MVNDALKQIWEKVDKMAGPHRLETEAEHIARDMREGRFPERSDRIQVPVDPHPMTHDTTPPKRIWADAALDKLIAEAEARVWDHAAQIGGDAAVEVLLRHEPDASPLKIQMTRQAIANPIRRAAKGETK